MANTDATAKLVALVVEAVNHAFAAKEDKDLQRYQELQIMLGDIKTGLQTLEGLSAGAKASKAAPKKTEAPAAEGAAAAAAAPAESFPSNSLLYFRQQYALDDVFRNKYCDAELKKLMDEDPTVKSKTNPKQRVTAETTFVWNYLKNNCKAKHEEIGKLFKEANEAHKAAAKPAQLAEEAVSP